jgi:hypothetical protein
MIKNFNDITLLDWFIPIVLDFKKFAHIYVKHVEETKFGEGQFKVRSFFDYKHTEILSLIKKVLSQEKEAIRDHFLLVSVGHNLNNKSNIKDYHRGFGKYPPIILGEDKFRLTIDKMDLFNHFIKLNN